MALRFQDFAPQVIDSGFFTGRQFESLRDALDAMNVWLAENELRVVNVETVVLPQIHAEDGTEDVELRTSGDFASQWYQFFRVWYHE